MKSISLDAKILVSEIYILSQREVRINDQCLITAISKYIITESGVSNIMLGKHSCLPQLSLLSSAFNNNTEEVLWTFKD